MLACAQDLYFHNEKSLTRKDSFPSIAHQDLHKVTKKTHMMSHHHHHHHSNHHHQEKDKEEQVWPPEVESAFIEALETIPKLGRRKILVNGKPCGRNELISDYIYRKTSKIRTRKQVSSHIQVLKNTRKSDPHFMRLLTDSVEVDEEFINRHKTTTKNNNNNHSTPVKRQHNTTKQNKQPSSFNNNNNNNNALPPQSTPTPLTQLPSNLSITSDESSIHSSPSPADYVFDMMYSSSSSSAQPYPLLDMKDSFYQPIPPPHPSQALFNHHPSNNNNNNNILSSPPPPSSSSTTSTSFMLTAPSTPMEFSSSFSNHHHHQQQQISYPPSQEFYSQDMMFQHDITNTTPVMTMKKNKSINQKTMPLLPNYIGLYLEYPSPYEPSMIMSHTLAQTNPLMDSYSSFLPSNDTIVKQKYHSLLSIHPTLSSLSTDQILLAKMKLDLNLNMNDYVFNNTSFFESMERKTIECTTTIYSFGSVVLESKELQQALLMDQKYMYSFVYVNQFFDAFMKGILSLPSWHEMDMAIQNLSIVQVFEEINDQVSSSSSMDRIPLLAMVYDFERGHGTIDLNTL